MAYFARDAQVICMRITSLTRAIYILRFIVRDFVVVILFFDIQLMLFILYV